MDKDGVKRITKQQDVNDAGQPIFRPEEKITEPVKSYWKWIWFIVIVLVVLVWLFLFNYFLTHQAPYAAPINQSATITHFHSDI